MVVPTRHGNSRAVPTPRANFSSDVASRSRRSAHFSRRYGLADPQPFRARLSTWAHMPSETCMETGGLHAHFDAQATRRAAGRPGALPNPRRARAQKPGGPTCEKGVRCAPPKAVVLIQHVVLSARVICININSKQHLGIACWYCTKYVGSARRLANQHLRPAPQTSIPTHDHESC